MTEPAAVPYHVGVIVDGNRRWAKKQGLPIIEGHRRGYKLLKDVADWLFEKGVRELSAYVFSTENWNRSKEEVENLMNLTRWVLKNEVDEMHKKNIRVRVSGLREKVSEDILQQIDEAVEKTKNNTKGILNLCFNYGGRPDILKAAKSLIKKGVQPKDVTEARFSQELSSAGLHNVDMVIRTSEYRLSNFLPWESAYAELYFLPQKRWPELTRHDFDEALDWFAKRKRRFGQ